MILADARKLLAARGRMSVVELALALDAPPQAVEGMMNVLQQSGRVREIPCGTCSTNGAGCSGCSSLLPKIYEWIASA